MASQRFKHCTDQLYTATASPEKMVVNHDLKYEDDIFKLQKKLQDIQYKRYVLNKHVKRQRKQSKSHRTVSDTCANETSLWSPLLTSQCEASHHGTYPTYAPTTTGELSYCLELSDCCKTPPMSSFTSEQSTRHDVDMYPSEQRTSTPRHSSSSFIQRQCLSDCVRQLVFGDSRSADSLNYSTVSSSNSSKDSGYTSLPPVVDTNSRVTSSHSSSKCSCRCTDQKCYTSANCHKCHKKHSTTSSAKNKHVSQTKKHRTIAKQLKRMGKEIHKHGGIENLDLNTLAVL